LLLSISFGPAILTESRPDPVYDDSVSADVPKWTIGDHWNYTTSFTFVYTIGIPLSIPFEGWINMSLSYIALEQTGNRDPVYVLDLEGNVTGHLRTILGDIWIYLDVNGYYWQRMQDLAIYRMVANVTVSGTVGSLNGFYPFGYEFQPALEEYDFPLIPGDEWSMKTFVTLPFSTSAPGFEMEGNSTCGHPANVTVPAGRFSAFPVRGSGGSLDYNSTVGNSIKRTMRVETGDIDLDIPLELSSYHRRGTDEKLWIRVETPQPVEAGKPFVVRGYYGGGMGSVSLLIPGSTPAGMIPIGAGPRAFNMTIKAPWDMDDTPTMTDHSSLGILAVSAGFVTDYAVCTVTTRATDLEINSSMVEVTPSGWGSVDDPLDISMNVGCPANFGVDKFFALLVFENPTGNTTNTSIGPYSVEAGEISRIDVRLAFDLPGMYNLTVTIDPEDEIPEISESNNVAIVNFTVHPRSPLNWTVSPGEGIYTLAEGEDLNLSAIAKRRDILLSGTWTLNGTIVGIDGNITVSTTFEGPNSSEGSPYSLKYTLDPGSYKDGERHEVMWELFVIDVDRPYVVLGYDPPEADLFILEGESLAFNIRWHDPDGDEVHATWTRDDLIVGVGPSYLFRSEFTGMNSSVGSPFNISVMLAGDRFVFVNWTVTVTDVDRPPSIFFDPADENLTIRSNMTIALGFDIDDPDLDRFFSRWSYLGFELFDVSTMFLNVTGMALGDNETFAVSLNVGSGSFGTNRTWNITYLADPIVPEPPKALQPQGVFIVSPLRGFKYKLGQTVVLEASAADDRPINYTWNLNETLYFGRRIEVKNLLPGEYPVSLNVSVDEPVPAWIGLSTNFTVTDIKPGPRDVSEDSPLWPLLILIAILLALIGIALFLRTKMKTSPAQPAPTKKEDDVWGE
jgi:hypothetical protein